MVKLASRITPEDNARHALKSDGTKVGLREWNNVHAELARDFPPFRWEGFSEEESVKQWTNVFAELLFEICSNHRIPVDEYTKQFRVLQRSPNFLHALKEHRFYLGEVHPAGIVDTLQTITAHFEPIRDGVQNLLRVTFTVDPVNGQGSEVEIAEVQFNAKGSNAPALIEDAQYAGAGI